MAQHEESSGPLVGQRRRRREAQREAQRRADQWAEETGQIPLPTRRELRRREAEEAARQEALATGELALGVDGELIVLRGQDSAGGAAAEAGPAEPAAPSEPAERVEGRGESDPLEERAAEVIEHPDAEVREEPVAEADAPSTAETPVSADEAPAASPDSAASADPAPSETSTPDAAPAEPGPGDSAPTDAGGPGTEEADAAEADRAEADTGEADTGEADTVVDAAPVRVTRRSMREQLRAAAEGASEPAAERPAMGRRPVVRTPVTARGVRGIDSTGALSAVQPVAPATESSGEITLGFHALLDDSAVSLPAILHEPLDASSIESPAEPGNDEPTADGEAEEALAETTPGSDALRPRWYDVAGAAQPARSRRVARRSLRTGAEPSDDGDRVVPGATAEGEAELPAEQGSPAAASPQDAAGAGDRPRGDHPALQLVKLLVLVLVGIIIGGLVWLLAGRSAGDTDDTEGAFPHLVTTGVHTTSSP